MIDKKIILNGELLEEKSPIFFSSNRSFRYGDSIFESIRITGDKVMFLQEHINRLVNAMATLKMEIPTLFSAEYFHAHIQNLVNVNCIGTEARVRITVYRNEGGHYAPQDNTVSYLVEIFPVEENGYPLNEKGFTIDVFQDFKKPKNKISSFKTGNSILYVLAGIYKNQHKLDDCIVLNEKGNIAESINSNVFIVKNGAIYTPSLDECCTQGVMRNFIIRLAKENRIAVNEISLTANTLLGADEVFITNAVKGIQWVGAYKAKRYFNTITKLLSDKLNQKVNA